MAVDFSGLQRELEAKCTAASSARELMESMVTTLHDRVPHYHWVGFYLLSADGIMLKLGPFAGAATPHTRIPLNQGICGAAVTLGETLVVDDVNSDPRYLACSLETKSEIVVPIYRHGKIVGELDIDSHTPAAFTKQDREFVEACARLVGELLEARAA